MVRSLGLLVVEGTHGGLTDAELLERFVSRPGDAAAHAFEGLVLRHGPMVSQVCQRFLGNPHDAVDAFQATFLVPIKKAGTIRGHEAVGGWMPRVAHRVAVQAGRDRSQIDRREYKAGDLPERVAARDIPDDDWLVTARVRDRRPEPPTGGDGRIRPFVGVGSVRRPPG